MPWSVSFSVDWPWFFFFFFASRHENFLYFFDNRQKHFQMSNQRSITRHISSKKQRSNHTIKLKPLFFFFEIYRPVLFLFFFFPLFFAVFKIKGSTVTLTCHTITQGNDRFTASFRHEKVKITIQTRASKTTNDHDSISRDTTSFTISIGRKETSKRTRGNRQDVDKCLGLDSLLGHLLYSFLFLAYLFWQVEQEHAAGLARKGREPAFIKMTDLPV